MSFNVEVGVRQGYVMSPWLFNIYIEGCIREMKVGVRDLGARLREAIAKWVRWSTWGRTHEFEPHRCHFETFVVFVECLKITYMSP